MGLCVRAFGCSIFAFVAWACVGDDPVVSTGNGADGGLDTGGGPVAEAGADVASAADGGAADGASNACEPILGNLLTNGSFEKLSSTSGTVTMWVSTPPLSPRTGDADDCATWVEHESTSPDDQLDHDIALASETPAGTIFEIGASLKSLDGNTNPIEFELRVISGGYKPKLSQQLSDGAWVRASVELELAEAAQQIRVSLRPHGPRKIGIDRVYAVQK